MGSTARFRFVAFERADGWIELARKPRWELRHCERDGTLILSVFPVAEGVTMDLAALVHLEHERQRSADEIRARMKEYDPANRRPWMMRESFLDETTWSEGRSSA